jgi:hypothetical protein
VELDTPKTTRCARQKGIIRIKGDLSLWNGDRVKSIEGRVLEFS